LLSQCIRSHRINSVSHRPIWRIHDGHAGGSGEIPSDKSCSSSLRKLRFSYCRVSVVEVVVNVCFRFLGTDWKTRRNNRKVRQTHLLIDKPTQAFVKSPYFQKARSRFLKILPSSQSSQSFLKQIWFSSVTFARIYTQSDLFISICPLSRNSSFLAE
jgi:hypothetical protein